MIANQDAYIELIQAIMPSKLKIYGSLAIARANSVAGLKLDDKGAVVSLTGDPVEILSQLLQRFEELSGKTSTYTAIMNAERVLKKYPDLAVPSILHR